MQSHPAIRFDLGGDQLGDPLTIEAIAGAAERDGYDGVQVPETNHDPFVTLALAARMRDFVAAIRAIWAGWDSGERPQHRGEFYTHTMMSPFFDPGPNPFGHPAITLAAIGELMTKVAGEVADRCLVHTLTPRRYLDVATRQRIAFYGSTPAYRTVLELHGWSALHARLHGASRRGEWDLMGEMIDDEVLTEFAAVGTVAQLAQQLLDRFGPSPTDSRSMRPMKSSHRPGMNSWRPCRPRNPTSVLVGRS